MLKILSLVAVLATTAHPDTAIAQKDDPTRLSQELAEAVSQQVTFTGSDVTLSPSARIHLETTASLMNRFTSAKLRLAFESSAPALARQRAAAVKSFLTSRNVAESRITLISVTPEGSACSGTMVQCPPLGGSVAVSLASVQRPDARQGWRVVAH